MLIGYDDDNGTKGRRNKGTKEQDKGPTTRVSNKDYIQVM